MDSEHKKFVVHVVVIGMSIMVVAVAQWHGLAFIPGVRPWTVQYVFLFCTFIGIAFIFDVVYTFLFQEMRATSKILLFVVLFIAIEFSTVIVIRPIMDASLIDFFVGLICCIFMLCITILMTTIARETMFYQPVLVILWTLRFYLLSCMGTMMTLALESDKLEAVLTLVLDIIIFVHTVSIGKSLASTDFYQTESTNVMLHAMIFYLNYATFYGNALLFSNHVRHFIDAARKGH